MTNEKRYRYLRSYFNIACVTLVSFMTSFGVLFIKDLMSSSASAEDNGLGLAAVFLFPAGVAFLLLLSCAYLLFWRKNKTEIDPLLFVFLSVLTIPVAIFGFFTVVASVRILIGLLGHF